jgi:hypothetical protein
MDRIMSYKISDECNLYAYLNLLFWRATMLAITLSLTLSEVE